MPKGRVKSRRHWFLDGWPSDKWNPDAVGVVHSYPKTQEKFDELRERSRLRIEAMRAAGKPFTRKGVPDGMARRGTGVQHFRALAKHEAQRIFDYMMKEDLLVEPENTIANDALLVAIELSRGVLVDDKLRLAAARTVLEWTKPKPATTVNSNVRTAESFLRELAADSREK